MIQPNELRIGNLVKSSGTDIEGHPGYKHEVVVVVEDVLSDGINLYYERAIYDLDSLSGIPLTPEWLKRFGFIDPAENGWGLRLSVNSVDELCWYLQDEPAYGGPGGIIRYQTKGAGFTRQMQVKAVHQLQNLFFALTGQELTVKEKV